MTETRERIRLPAALGVVALVLAFLAWLVPVLVLPFANELPYLQSVSFLRRLTWSALFFFVACAIGRMAMTSQQWADVRKVALSGWVNVVGSAAGLLMAISAAAHLSANTFGLLVKMFPAESFTQDLVVASARTTGTKFRAIELRFQPTDGGTLYELTLSRRLFNELPVVKPGDVLQVTGEHNLFGSYVHTFRVQTQTGTR